MPKPARPGIDGPPPEMTANRRDPDGAIPDKPERRHARIHWSKPVALLLLVAAVGFLIYQNLEEVRLRAFWWEFHLPLVVVIVVAGLLTLTIEALVKAVIGWRRRHPRLRPPR